MLSTPKLRWYDEQGHNSFNGYYTKEEQNKQREADAWKRLPLVQAQIAASKL